MEIKERLYPAAYGHISTCTHFWDSQYVTLHVMHFPFVLTRELCIQGADPQVNSSGGIIIGARAWSCWASRSILAFPSSLCLPADLLMLIRVQANVDAVIQPLLCFGLTVGVIFCRDIFFLPAASRLHRTSTLFSSRYQYPSQATKLTMTSCPLAS